MSEKPAPYKGPTIFDFQRNLDTIAHEGARQARAEVGRLISEFAARGLAQSTPLIGAVIKCFDKIHADTLERAMNLIAEFASKELSLGELAKACGWRLENFAATLLSTVPPAGFPHVAEQFRRQYAAVFQQRLDGALRDIAIGFVSGRRITIAAPEVQVTAKLGDAVILKPTFMGLGLDLNKAWNWATGKWRLTRRG